MTSRLLVGLALFALLLWGAPAQATDSFGHVVTACGLEAYKVGNSGPFTLLATGELCSTGGGGGGGGTSSAFGGAFPATGTAIGVKSGANMVNLTADGSNNLNINCVVGCAGGTFNNNADAVATSATNGQTAAWNYGFNGTTWDRLRVDGSKNLLIAGTVTANAGTNLNTSLLALESGGNLATLAGGVTASVYQTNEKQINGVTPLMGNGVTGTGAQRVTIASDNTAFTVNAAESGTWNITNISGTITLPTLAATSTKQSDGSQKTQIVDGSGNVIASTSNNLNVQCANCSGSGASAADEASFTVGTSVFAPSGGFFQTTATSNALTNGQQGQVQMTANRAFMVNLRNASGVELGVAATPVQVSLANTGANATAVLVNQPTAASFNATVVGTGTFATQSAITAASGSIASGAVASGAIASGAVASGAYASGSISDGAIVTLGAKADAKSTATDTTAITIMQVLKEISAMAQAPAALPSNQSVNVTQTNGVTPLMGNGVTGTGSQRVTIASDNTPFPIKIDQTTPGSTNGVSTVAATSGGTTLYTLTLAASTNATNVKASAGQVYSISGFNMSSATPIWVSLYNNAGTPTCGTSIIQQFMIPGSTTGAGFVYDFATPKAFATGIAFCATTGIAGTGSAAATTYVLNIDYK